MYPEQVPRAFANRNHKANHGFVILNIFFLNSNLVHLEAGQRTLKSLFIRAQGLPKGFQMKVKMTLLNFFLVQEIRNSNFAAEFGHFHSQNCQTLIQNDYVGSFITVYMVN